MAAAGNLNVELCGAIGLKNSEFIGKSDPYALLSIGKTEKRSKAADDQADAPQWNEKFTIPVLDTDTELLIRILNDNTMGKDDEMGRVAIPLVEIHGGSYTYPLELKGKPQGEIKLNFEFDGEGHKGLLEKLTDLFVGKKDDDNEREKKELGEHHHDMDLSEKAEDKVEEMNEKTEDKKEEAEEKAEEKKEEAEEKGEEKEYHDDKDLSEKTEEKIEELKEKAEGKKVKKEKKGKKDDEEGSSSSSDSESEKDE